MAARRVVPGAERASRVIACRAGRCPAWISSSRDVGARRSPRSPAACRTPRSRTSTAQWRSWRPTRTSGRGCRSGTGWRCSDNPRRLRRGGRTLGRRLDAGQGDRAGHPGRGGGVAGRAALPPAQPAAPAPLPRGDRPLRAPEGSAAASSRTRTARWRPASSPPTSTTASSSAGSPARSGWSPASPPPTWPRRRRWRTSRPSRAARWRSCSAPATSPPSGRWTRSTSCSSRSRSSSSR